MATEGIQRGHMSLHARCAALRCVACPRALPLLTMRCCNVALLACRNVAVTALGGPEQVSALNSGPKRGEGTRRLEMIAAHLAESGSSVSVSNAKEFAKQNGWVEAAEEQ
eukprot:COSAG06_NODE_8590_length_2122_cov_1.855660_2_plen_110_part_00